MMGSFYQHCSHLQQWIYENTTKGVVTDFVDNENPFSNEAHQKELRKYLVGFFETLLSDARNGGESWEQLMSAQTKGGLNEQAMGLMAVTKELTHNTLDTIVDRLQNKGQN